jgi:hypothetical protein
MKLWLQTTPMALKSSEGIQPYTNKHRSIGNHDEKWSKELASTKKL